MTSFLPFLPIFLAESPIDDNISESCLNECLQNQSPAAFGSHPSMEPSWSDSQDNISLADISVADLDNGFSGEHRFLKSNNYPFICNVNSLAWGVCGDTYDAHEDVSFREFLFVTDDYGVTVHAFRVPDETALTRPKLEGEFGQGRWVTWGPSTKYAQNRKSQDILDMYSEGGSTTVAVQKTKGNEETQQDTHKETGVDHLSSGVASKRWLRSFFTKAKTIKFDGNIRTRFPEKTSFPGSAKVVSFSILDENLPVLDFLSHENFLSNKGGSQDTLDARPYKCSRVFSSNSHCLVGFVLTLSDSLFAHTPKEIESSIKALLLVARLDGLGIHWVSFVKLAESANVDPLSGWTDFGFSDNLLVCLNASGLIYFYAVMSGECIAHMDVLQACGFDPKSRPLQQEKVATVDPQMKPVHKIHDMSTSQVGDSFGRRMFRKLLVVSHTSLLAVVDECGIIYVICAGDYMPEKYYAYEKLLPHFQHLRLGTLVGWEVGGSDIGYQMVYCNNSFKRKVDNFHGRGEKSDFFSSITSDNSFPDSEVHLQPMRHVFLPTERFSEDDCICFSPLGITRLTKRHGIKNQPNVLIHLNLHMGLAVRDERCLDSGGKMFDLQGKEEASVGEAIGCTFHGCLYLVNKVGLAVVLPSVSFSSNFLPVETFGYRLHSFDKGARYPVKRTHQIRESKELFSAWKVEVLDRVLTFEGPEEADRLCLENGKKNIQAFQVTDFHYNMSVASRISKY